MRQSSAILLVVLLTACSPIGTVVDAATSAASTAAGAVVTVGVGAVKTVGSVVPTP